MKSNIELLLLSLFTTPPILDGQFARIKTDSIANNQQQTNDVFTEKWKVYQENSKSSKEGLYKFQLEWYLRLYGFITEEELKKFLSGKKVILDAGCGLGYKAAWFAKLAPHALVIGIDFSEAAEIASKIYADIPNLVFIQGDIGKTDFNDGAIDYVSCDQVIMHTENPEATFKELSRITAKPFGEFACYFYAKKALPRELLDDYFRAHCKDLSNQELWEFSEQLTELGKRLSDLNAFIDVPDIPLLGIKGGTMDIQRFIYWHFIKCFWNKELGEETSVATNFDWYSPSNARRFTELEVREIVSYNDMHAIYFHAEEACYSGRFGFGKK
jgi:ubiquinone/menaquinone biosynthesis C-methylase UbiE